MSIKPMNGNLVIEPKEPEQTTESGIALPTQAHIDDQGQGLVIAVSDGAPVKVGQEVLYKKYSGEPFKEDNKQYVLIHEVDLLAIVTT